jgi:WD40 repeat protein
MSERLKHDAAVWSAQFSPDGQRVVTASDDGTARVWDAPTGQPLSEPLRHGKPVKSAEFSEDGQQVVTISGDKITRVWDVPVLPMPVPSWLPDLAEAFPQRRINSKGIFESVPVEELLRMRELVQQRTAQDFYSRWAGWLFADRHQRTISPFSMVTVPEYVQRRIDENTLESLLEAVQLAPTNALAFARLAAKTLEQSDNDNPRRMGEADFYSRRAIEWSPNDAQVRRIRAEIAEQIKNVPKS